MKSLMTREKRLELAFQTINSFSKNTADPQRIADAMLRLSGAAIVSLNLLNNSKSEFRTVAISFAEPVTNIGTTLGFDPLSILWTENPKRQELIAEEKIRLMPFRELTEGILPESAIKVVESQGLLFAAIAKLEIDGETIGEFNLLYRNVEDFGDEDIIKAISNQLGLYLAKKEAVELLQGNKSRVDFILESAGAGSWEWDITTGENKVDERLAAMLCYRLEDLMPATEELWARLVHPDDIEFVNTRIEKVINDREGFFSAEYRMVRKDGETIWVLDMAKVLSRAGDGAPLIMYGTIIDVTDKKRLKVEAKDSEDRFKTLVESSFSIIYSLTLEGLFKYISPAWTRILGYSVEEALGKSFRPYVHPEDLEKVEEIFYRISTQKKRGELTGYRLRHKDGNWVWFETNSTPIWDEEGFEVIGYAGMARDITRLVEYAAELNDKKDELERFFNVNLDLLCIADLEGNFLKANTSWETTLGYPLEFIVSSKIDELIHPEDIDSTNAALSDLGIGKSVTSFINRYRCFDGSYKYLEWRAIPFGDLIYGAARDVTENKRMEAQILLEKELFKTTLMSVGDGVIAADNNGNITLMNMIAEKLTGWSAEEGVGKRLEEIFEIYVEGSSDPCDDIFRKIIEVENIFKMGDIILRSNKGFDIHVEISSAPIKDKLGNITGIVIVFRDYTEKKEKQREVEYLSFHDHLTGLYNRRYMEDSMDRLDTPRNLPFTMLMVDIDGLKITNDIFGHRKGDELIKRAADIIKRACRNDDIVCRIGGDEFAVLLPKTTERSAKRIKTKIEEFARNSSSETLEISLAVGHATKSSTLQSLKDVLKNADDDMYRDKLKKSESFRLRVIDNILKTIYKEYEMEKVHSERVSRYSSALAKEIGFSDKKVEDMRMAGLFHDIGKINMSFQVLNKKGPLTEDEYEDVKRHSEASYRILRSVDEFSGSAESVLYHHERYDGKGYPMGLKGEQIPIESRIITIADAYEAMTSNRPYRDKISHEEAVKELIKNSGTQFDPVLVDTFIHKFLGV